MKQKLKWTLIVLLGVLVGSGSAIAFVSGVRVVSPATLAKEFMAQVTANRYGGLTNVEGSGLASERPYAPAPWPRGEGFASGMMAGYGDWGMTLAPALRCGASAGVGRGMHGYGRDSWTSSDDGKALTADQAGEATRQYLLAIGDPDLEAVELMEFSNHFYVEVEETSTGIHAFELLVGRTSGEVFPEPGPNMMWNIRYGHMASGGEQPELPMTVTPERAKDIAQRWLDIYMPGYAAAGEADAFYGYYTIHVLSDGEVIGMLSVNGYTGKVWYHEWHGNFIQIVEMES